MWARCARRGVRVHWQDTSDTVAKVNPSVRDQEDRTSGRPPAFALEGSAEMPKSRPKVVPTSARAPDLPSETDQGRGDASVDVWDFFCGCGGTSAGLAAAGLTILGGLDI